MTFGGTVQNGTVVLDGDVVLPEGTRVKVVADVESKSAPSAKDLLNEFAGCMTDLPNDLARNHDHYLHGTPKQ